MDTYLSYKEKAITLRKQGKTYCEILAVVPVVKSTLSLWLRSVSLATPQKQRLTTKKHESQKRGAQARKTQRLLSTRVIQAAATEEVGSLTLRERLLIGAALYWAEGSKEKTYRPSVRLEMANSDPEMVRFFMRWLRENIQVPDEQIILIVHLHRNHLHDLSKHTQFWLDVTGLTKANCGAPIIKTHNPKTKRHNIAETYRGLATIRVRRSVSLNRHTQGLIYGIISAP